MDMMHRFVYESIKQLFFCREGRVGIAYTVQVHIAVFYAFASLQNEIAKLLHFLFN